ncbi:hypothetical protein [Flavobacterium sp.]
MRTLDLRYSEQSEIDNMNSSFATDTKQESFPRFGFDILQVQRHTP